MAARPRVGPVKDLDLRSINNALNLIQDQVAKVADVADYAVKQSGNNSFLATQGSGSLAQVQQQLNALQTSITALTQGSLTPTAAYRADSAIASFDPVFVTSDGGVSAIDTQDPTQIFACIGVATSNASIGDAITIRRSGIQVGAGVGWDAGRAVYAQVGSGQGLTQWPNYAAVALPVGVAINATDLEVRPAWPALHEKPIYGGGYEDFMPVTLQLVRTALELVDSLAGQPEGFVVKANGVLTTRVLVDGAGITITNTDGVAGDPAFSVP